MSVIMSKKEARLNYLYHLGKLSKVTYWAEREFNWRPLTGKENDKEAWYQYLLLGCFDNSYKYPEDCHDEKLRGTPIQKFAWRIGRQNGKTEILSIGALFLALCRPVHYTKIRRYKDHALIGSTRPDGSINETGWTEIADPYIRGAKIIVGSADADKARTIFDRVMKFIESSEKLTKAMENGSIIKKLHPFPELVFKVAGWTEDASITFRGPGAGGQTARSKTFDYKLYDEADWMPAIFFEAEKATSINAGDNSLVILSSTPTGKREHFYNACFVKDTPVAMADGSTKSIQDVQKGELVLNRFGQPEAVTATMQRNVVAGRTKLISFMTTLNDTIITATSLHRFMAARQSDRYCAACSKFIWKNRSDCVLHGEHTGLQPLEPKYFMINELSVGDYLAIPLAAVDKPKKVFLGTIVGDFLYVPIKQYVVQIDFVPTLVYNLTVGEDHSYCVNGYGVANCTNPNWNYQEFHVPSKENPNFTVEFNQEFLNEHPLAVYQHEIEAEWGTVEEGVFDWTYFEWVFRFYDECPNLKNPDKPILTPVYRIFDTHYNFKRKPFPDEYERVNLTPSDVSKIGHNNLGIWLRTKFPPRIENKKYWFGADFGYQADPSEFVVFEEYNGVMKLILRIHMQHVPYLTQCDIIALLDNFYLFAALGMDQGSNGLMVEQVLKAKELGHNKFKLHNFEKRMHAVNFSNKVEVSNKFNNEKRLVPVKQFMTDCIIMAAQNRQIIMPGVDVDDDIENQFRNHTYTVGSNGMIIYSKSTVFPDHCLVPGTMITTDHGNVPIEQINIRDKVLTRQGYKEVTFSGKTMDNASTFNVELSNGVILRGTNNHPVFVKNHNEFVRLDELKIGDEIYSIEELNKTQCESNQDLYYNENISSIPERAHYKCQINMTKPDLVIPNKSFSMEQFTDVTLMLLVFQKENIINHRTMLDMLNGYIEQFGNLLMEQFHQNITSTIKMAMLIIMIYLILNAFQVKGITQNIVNQSVQEVLQQNNWSILKKFDHLQKNGMHQKLDMNGTLNMVNELLLIDQYWISFVKCVKHHFIASKLGQDFAVTNVKLNGTSKITPIMVEKLYVNGANENSETSLIEQPLVPIRVVRISDAPKSNVYDLTVKDAHEFFANGVLVHNCVDAIRTCFFAKSQNRMPVNRPWPIGNAFRAGGGSTAWR